MIWNKTLDPNSPDFKWEEGGIVASSDGVEDCNSIDPAVFLDPTNGRMWGGIREMAGRQYSPRLSNCMFQAQQKWTITPVANAGGYPGSPYFKITIAGTDRALAATDDAELVALPAFTGGPEQLWRIDQLTDGTYRIMPKAVPGSKEPSGAFGHRQQFCDLGQVQCPGAIGSAGI